MAGIGSPLAWTAFIGFLLGMLALDLGVFHRRPRAATTREAAIWSAVWILLSAAFALFLLAQFGEQRALEFTTGYLIEKALAVDNLFIFVIVFSAFSLPRDQEHRVLFFGVLGALVMRAGLVVAGGLVLERFHWSIYLFGALLVAAGLKLLLSKSSGANDNFAVRLARKLIPVAPGEHRTFTVVQQGRRLATPLLLALVAVEAADLAFAVESIPAVYAITPDPFIVFTSNALALLGLRSLYFLLAGWLEKFTSIKPALSIILIFVGAKMLLDDVLEISPLISVATIAAILAIAMLFDVAKSHGSRRAKNPIRVT